MTGFKMKVTPEIENLTEVCKEHSSLDLSLYQKYDVKRGLRDINGKGVLAGLTQISNVCATKVVDGKEVPCAGSLSYRGYDIKELTRGFISGTAWHSHVPGRSYFLRMHTMHRSYSQWNSQQQDQGYPLPWRCRYQT